MNVNNSVMLPLHAISVFVRIVEAKSITEAARRMGVSPAAASKSLTRLEDRLGVRLLHRTTRRLSLTDEGALFFERCRQLISDIEDAEAMLTQRQVAPRGTLRVQAPVSFGRTILGPLLAQFIEQFPNIQTNVEFSDRIVDLAESGIDVLIWTGERKDSSVVARKLFDSPYVLVASPAYIEKWGEPKDLDELSNHQCLGFYLPHVNQCREWSFVSRGQTYVWEVSGPLNMNSGAALLDATVRGVGIARVPMFLAAGPVRAGQLKIVLEEHILTGPATWIGYLSRPHLSPRIRAFVDFVTTEVSSHL